MHANFIKTLHNPNSIYINPQNKWLWLRVHKTAGTSMYDGFLHNHCYNIVKNHPKKVKQWLQTITDAELQQYTIWTCVRNPYTRFHSIAAMFGLDPNNLAQNFHQLRHQNNMLKRHSETQHSFTHNQGVQVPQIVLKFENLNTDFANLCKTLNLPVHTLQKLNSSKHGKWQHTFSVATINFINEFYQLDFKHFNYNLH